MTITNKRRPHRNTLSKDLGTIDNVQAITLDDQANAKSMLLEPNVKHNNFPPVKSPNEQSERRSIISHQVKFTKLYDSMYNSPINPRQTYREEFEKHKEKNEK